MFLIASLWVDFLVLFLLLWGLSGNKVIALLVCLVFYAILTYFKLPQVEKRVSDAILKPDESGRLPIIAHRGGSLDAPENTVASIREAKRNGAQAVELDLAFTKDGVAVLLHDMTVDRTTNGSGFINEMTYEQTQQLDASEKHEYSDHFPNEKIPTFEEALVECINLGLKVYIDVKGNGQTAADAIVDVYKKHPSLYTMGIVCSFHPDVIYAVRKADSDIVTGLTHRPGIVGYLFQHSNTLLLQTIIPILDIILEWCHFHWLWYLVGNSAFLAREDQISKRFIQFWEERGVRVVVWTVNEQLQKEYFSKSLGIPYMTDTLKVP